MRKLLASAALLAGTLMATPAIAAVDYYSDVSLWQADAGLWTEDTLYGAEFSAITALTLDDGTMLAFGAPVQIRDVPSSWATWCCGYGDDVLYSMGAMSVSTTFLTPVDGFGFYAEPNVFAEYRIKLMLSDGSSLTQIVDGDAGAKFFGYLGAGIAGFEVSTTDSTGFAFGDFFVTTGAIPEPATWAMMILGFGLAGTAVRRRRKALSVSFA